MILFFVIHASSSHEGEPISGLDVPPVILLPQLALQCGEELLRILFTDLCANDQLGPDGQHVSHPPLGNLSNPSHLVLPDQIVAWIARSVWQRG